VKKEFKDKTAWYDGYLFEKIMDKRSTEMFVGPISELIEEGSSVIDIGCGIGSLALSLAGKCSKIVGIDVSSKMVNYAKKRGKDRHNVEFHHLCASLLPETFPDKFDYGVMSQMLHEAPEESRKTIIDGAKNVAGRLIIADYTAPLPKDMYGRMIKFVERLAGFEHNRNFGSWQSIGGLDGFISRHGLRVEEVRPYRLRGKEIGIGKIVKVGY
jgi:SAM-dependent methyltransferase